MVEKKMFDQRCDMREVKRKLGEAEGDEDLLISRREKRRKREEGSIGFVSCSIPLICFSSLRRSPSPRFLSALRLSLRKPDPNNITPASLVPSSEELQARKSRNENLVKQIERELQRKRQADAHWDDWTDSSYLARPPPTPARFWRSVEPTPNSIPFSSGKRETLGFATTWQAPIGRVRSSFRKRIGRGGRVFLDRIAPARRGDDDQLPPYSKQRMLPSLDDTDDESDMDEMDEWMVERRNERLKYDTDAGLDFPAADEPRLLDDYDLRHLVRRAGLLKPQDLQSLSVDSSYLEEAFKFVATDPDKNQPPPTVIGRPPPRPPLQMQPSGQPLGGAQLPSNPAAYAQAQAGIAAQQNLRAQQQVQLAQAQALAQQRQRQAQATGSPTDQMRRTPSSNHGSPVGMNQSHLPLPVPLNGAGQPQWNGQGNQGGFPNHLSPPQNQHSPHSSPQAPNGLPLPPGQQQQRMPNGGLSIPGHQPNGANGIPATSRLSHPPFSNPQAIQLAIQQQQAAMQAAGMGRPLSANSQVPSRPGSSASSSHHQHSPAMAALSLPPQGSPHLSPVAAAAALNLRQQGPPGTPPPGSAGLVGKRGSPMNYQMQAGGVPQQQQQQLKQSQPGYGGGGGGFVQG